MCLQMLVGESLVNGPTSGLPSPEDNCVAAAGGGPALNGKTPLLRKISLSRFQKRYRELSRKVG